MQVVAGATIALIAGNGPMMQFTFGVFLKPIGDELALSRGTVSAALSLGVMGTAFAAPFVGRAMDRFGTTRVIVPSIFAFALLLALQGWLARGAASLFLLSALMGIAAGGQTPVGYARVIVTWFESRRGLALGVAMTGVGIGTIVMPLLAARFTALVGWRVAYAYLALVLLAVALPAVLLCIRDGPLRAERRHDRRGDARAARRTPAFLKLAGAFTLVAFAANGTIAHIVPMMTDRGMSAAAAASSFVLVGAALIAGRLVAGWLLDRIDPILITTAFFGFVLFGLLLLAGGTIGGERIALLLIGLGLGAEIDLLAFLVARFFGMAVFGEIYGALFGLFVVGSGLGPLFVGATFDRTGSYRVGLFCLCACIVAAIVLVLWLRRSTRSHPAISP